MPVECKYIINKRAFVKQTVNLERADTKGSRDCQHIDEDQERMKVREVIPHMGPIPIVIPLKLFLEGIDFLADNVTSRVTWKLCGGLKVQKHVKRSW